MKLNYITCLIALTTLLSAQKSAAQPFCNIDIYNIHDGLPSNYISAITQTPDGLVWISTWNGICFHDGYRFVSVGSMSRHGQAATNRYIDLKSDSSGNLWAISYDKHLFHLATSTLDFTEIVPRDEKKTPVPFTPSNIYPGAQGNVWITGAKGDPLLRVHEISPLDTTKFQLITPKETLGATVNRVETDSKGHEWLITNKGAILYGSEKRLKEPIAQFVDVHGTPVFGTADGRLFRYMANSGKFERLFTGAYKPGRITCLTPFGNRHLAVGTDIGTLIINTETSAVSRLDGEWNVNRVFADSHGALWVYTDAEGIFYYPTHESPAIRLQSAATASAVTWCESPVWVEDAKGTVWVVPNKGVFSYYDPALSQLVPYSVRGSLNPARKLPNIEKTFVDHQGNLWAASNRDLALLTFRHSTFTRSPLEGQEVRSLLPMADGGFLAGTASGQLAQFGPDGKLLHYLTNVAGRLGTSSTPAPFSERIYALYRDHAGAIWVGTKSVGLFRIQNGLVSQYSHNPSDPTTLSCDTVYCIDQDAQGNIWVGTYGGGLNKAVASGDGKYTFLNYNNGMTGYPIKTFGSVRRVTHDKSGAILVSTNNGLLTFSNAGRATEYRYFQTRAKDNAPNSLHNNNVMQTLVASDGSVYVVTLSGTLQKVSSPSLLADNLSFTDCNTSTLPEGIHGSTDDGGNLLSIIEDPDGNLCAVSEVKLRLRLAKEGRHASLGANIFGHHNEFTEAMPVYNPVSDKIIVGVIGGVVSFTPESMKPDTFEPSIAFTTVHYRGDNTITSLLNTEKFEAPSGKRDMTITFSALDYAARDGVAYAYMIEGVDKEWIYLGNNNSIHLSHLKAGNHALLVRACNGDGVWSEQPAKIIIRCLPTFWETPWAKILYCLLAVGLIALAVHTFWLRKRNLMRADMDRMKNKFYTDASHRLRTPLTLIGGPAAELLKDPNLSEESRENVEILLRNSNNMLAVVNNMLKYARDHSEEVYISDEKVPEIGGKSHGAKGNGDVAPEFNTLENISAEDSDMYREFFRTPAADDDADREETTILIVEDNDDLRTYLANILRDKYKVLTAPNGLVGLHIAEQQQPDFILTDVMMPEMDGLTMVHHIKQSKALSHIPIVVLSAKASMADRVQGLSEGIDDYITKPFTAGYLRQRIANIVARRRMLRQTYLDGINLPAPGPQAPAPQPVKELVLEGATVSGAPSAEVTLAPAVAEVPAVSELPEVPQTAETEPDVAIAEPTEVAAAPEAAPQGYTLDSPQIVDADQEMMDKLLKFIEDRIDDESLKIEELAESVNLGRTVFYGKIKSLVGMSPSDFLRHLRLKRAEELITKSKMNLSQIAYNVGFSDPKYFTKCFKKEMGMTPSQYRQNAKKSF